MADPQKDPETCPDCGWHRCKGGTNRHMRVAEMRGKKLCFRGNSFPAADLACTERLIARLRSEAAARDAERLHLLAAADILMRWEALFVSYCGCHVYNDGGTGMGGEVDEWLKDERVRRAKT